MIKKILRIIGLLIILWFIGFLIGVRSGKLNVKGGNGITIFGYDLIEGKFVLNGYKTYSLDGKDGIYLLDKGEKFEYLKVEQKDNTSFLSTKEIAKDSLIKIICEIDNESQDKFEVNYFKEEFITQASEINTESRIIAISDIEGNFNALSSFLLSNEIINSNFDWIFGDGHLVLVGDFMDRGKNVTECLWLIYKLEYQAKSNNGKVHFILGNHEAMNFQGKLAYQAEKYRGLIQAYTKEKNYIDGYKNFLNDEFVLGKWMKSKNVIQKINNTLFVHGGISPNVLSEKLSLDKINQIAKLHIHKDLYGKITEDTLASLIMGRKGPLWYRGMVKDYKDYYKKMKLKEFKEVLNFYDVEQIVIGHTVVKDIEMDYEEGLIKIDVKHGKEKHTGYTKGILIEENHIYKIDDKGMKADLKTM